MSRKEKRDKLAEDVCREFRYQITRPAHECDLNSVMESLIKWMKYAKKNKYTRP